MPRPKDTTLLSLFHYDDLNQIICNNGGCGGRVLNKHSTNLQRHLKVLHPSLYGSYFEVKKAIQSKNELNVQKKLIQLVRGRPVLWNNDSVSASTCQEWEQISRELDMDVDTCRQKWKHLRLRFTKDFLKRRRPEKEAKNSRMSPYYGNGKILTSLQFLHHEGIPEESSVDNNEYKEMSSKNSHIEEDSCNSSTLYNDEDEDSGLMQNKIKIYDKKSKEISTEVDEEADDYDCINENQIMEKKCKTQLPVENDAEKMFLLSLVPYLKAIPESRRLMARHRIQGILLEEQQRQIQLRLPVKIENASA